MSKLLFYFMFICFMLVSAFSEDQFIVFNSPKAIRFEGKDTLLQSNVKDVIATTLGFSTEAKESWNGLEVEKPFDFAEAVIVFHMVGMTPLSYGKDGSYPVIHDENADETFDALCAKTEQRFPDKSLELKKVQIADFIEVYNHNNGMYKLEVSTKGPIESINSSRPNSEVDNSLIKEINKLHSVIDQLIDKSNKDSVPDIYWFKMINMPKIIEQRGADSKEIFLNALKTLSNKIEKAYPKKALIVVLTENDALKTRSKRDATSPSEKVTLKSLGVVEDYDEDFPVIFNIMFWFSLAMLFALFSICMVIGGMDPGRDSIIYRMTSTRMKKDN